MQNHPHQVIAVKTVLTKPWAQDFAPGDGSPRSSKPRQEGFAAAGRYDKIHGSIGNGTMDSMSTLNVIPEHPTHNIDAVLR